MTAGNERTRRGRGRLRAAVAGAVVLTLAGIGFANASTVSVNGGAVSTVQAGPCTDAAHPITVERLWFIVYYAVRLSGLPASCQGKPIVVSAANNTVTGTSTGATSSSVQIGTDYAWNAPTFTVLIDGWVVPTTT